MGIDRRIEPESLFVLDCYQELLADEGQEGGDGFDDYPQSDGDPGEEDDFENKRPPDDSEDEDDLD